MIFFTIPFIATIIMAVLSIVIFMIRTKVGIKITTVLFGVNLIIAISIFSIIGWFLRDGLGPDAITTTGFKALLHFWQGTWPALIVIGLISALYSAGSMFSLKRIGTANQVDPTVTTPVD